MEVSRSSRLVEASEAALSDEMPEGQVELDGDTVSTSNAPEICYALGAVLAQVKHPI